MNSREIHVLLIDDSDSDRLAYRRALRRIDAQFRFTEARTSAEGVEKYRNGQPDLVLLDFQLPDDDGLSVLDKLAAEFPGAFLPVIMLTGAGTTEIAVESMKRGALDYVPKELIEPELLRRAVQRVVERAGLNRELESRQRELEQARRAAEEANEAKSQFLANMSHEIRTPLTSILGFTEKLRDEINTEEGGETLDTILRNGEHLLGLINQILDFSKIEAGQLLMDLGEVDLPKLLGEVAKLVALQAEEKDVSLQLEYVSPVPRSIRSDALRLRQVLINLLSNAIKFTGAGGSVLVLVFWDRNVNPPRLDVSILDSGIGIEKSQLVDLFQPFHQADAATTRRYGGTGLGLSISREIARLLGGDIEVVSHPGRGSAFRFSTPAGSSDSVTWEVGDPLESLECSASSGEGGEESNPSLECKVLYADDAPDIRAIVGHFLREAGCEVEVAIDGEDALRSVEASLEAGNPFDLVLLDVHMPNLDGVGAARALRARGWARPIVALTANAIASDHPEYLAAGFDRVATKPIDRPVLIAMLRELLELA